MEVCECRSIPLWVWSSSNFRCGISADYQRTIELISSVVSAVLHGFFYAILTFLFGVVGATLGAMTALMGALSGLKGHRSLFHGAAAGAIARAYFYLEFVKASVGLWSSFANGPVSFLHLIVVISELLNPTLLYLGELCGPVGIQDFQIGEVARILPLCHHTFHRSCIAKWHSRHSSCPCEEGTINPFLPLLQKERITL